MREHGRDPAATSALLFAVVSLMPMLAAGCSSSAPFLVPIPAPSGASVGPGDLSPDGTRFAYEVGVDDSTGAIWMLDPRSGGVRPIAKGGPGRRHEPAWSPDGTHLAYWTSAPVLTEDRASRHDGIYVLDVSTGAEVEVFRPDVDVGFAHTPRWTGPDSILFTYWRGTLDAGGDPWIGAADGSGAQRIGEAARHLTGRSPAGDRRAFFDHCCDAATQGIWVAPARAESAWAKTGAPARCVAGPLGRGDDLVWSRDGRRLFYTSRIHRDSAVTLWTSDVAAGGGTRVERPSGAVRGLSGSRTGMLALQVHNPGEPILWFVPTDTAAGRTLPGSGLPECPSSHPVVARFARAEGLTGEIRIGPSSRFDGSLGPGGGYDFQLVVVAYETEAGPRRRPAVRVGDRAGWVGGPCRVMRPWGETACPADPRAGVTFRARPEEFFLWSRGFLDRLAEHHWDRRWVDVLLADPGLPDGVLDSLLARERYDDRLVQDPRVIGRADRLVRMWSRHPSHGRVARAAFDALWRHGVAVVEDPDTPDALLRALAAAVPARVENELTAQIGRALLGHLELGRDPAVLAQLARFPRDADPDLPRVAGGRLLDDPAVSAADLEPALRAMAADAGLADRLFADPRVLGSEELLTRLARIPCQQWRLAERARDLLRDRRAREGRAAAAAGAPAGDRLPIALPDAWRDGDAGEVRPPFAVHADARAMRSALLALDPVTPRPRTYPPGPSRAELERALCEPARESDDAATLSRLVAGAVYATSTRVAACLLENPEVRDRSGLLEGLATMIDVNRDPDLPSAGSPAIAEIRSRARALRTEPGEDVPGGDDDRCGDGADGGRRDGEIGGSRLRPLLSSYYSRTYNIASIYYNRMLLYETF